MKLFYCVTAALIALSGYAADLGNIRHEMQADLSTRNVVSAEIMATKPEDTPKKALSLASANKKMTLKTERNNRKASSTQSGNLDSNTLSVLQIHKVSGDSYSIEGFWEFILGDYYFPTSIGDIHVKFEATLKNNDITFTDVNNNEFPIKGTYDESTGKLTFKREYTGTRNEYYVYQEPYVYNTEDRKMEMQTITAQFNADLGTITFGADNGIAWTAYNDEGGTSRNGYYTAYDLIEANLEGVVPPTPEKAPIEGLWEFLLGDYYWNESIGEFTANFEATLENGYVYFEDPSDIELPFIASFDESTNILTFNREYLGERQGYHVYQEPYVYNYGLDYQPITARFDPIAGTISFNQNEGIDWGGYARIDDPKSMASFNIYDLLSASKTTAVDSEENWEYYGYATFIDGWLLPEFEADQFDEEWWYEVPMDRNIVNPDLYRLVNPYHYGDLADINETDATGYIMFDVSDPDHVVFLKAEAGFASADLGVTKFYCYNMLGTYIQNGFKKEEVINTMTGKIPFTTFKNGVIDLSYIETETDGIIYDANFGNQSAPNGGYVWKGVNMCARIIFPEVPGAGIEEVENIPSETRYFNLQGVEVKNPQPGGLYIKVSGSKSEKTMIK